MDLQCFSDIHSHSMIEKENYPYAFFLNNTNLCFLNVWHMDIISCSLHFIISHFNILFVCQCWGTPGNNELNRVPDVRGLVDHVGGRGAEDADEKVLHPPFQAGIEEAIREVCQGKTNLIHT